MVLFPKTHNGNLKNENRYLILFLMIVIPFVVAMAIDNIFFGSRIPYILVSVIGSSLLIIAVLYFKGKDKI